MSEEIKTILTADPNAFESGIDRALASLTTFEKRTAQSKSAALPALELNPDIVRNLERAGARTQELTRQTMLAGRAGQFGSMGFLAFSQAVEDAQYGIRGILNNIPQMIIGFGGTMGLAGAISLAAVAAVNLYPLLQRLNGDAFSDAVAKGREEWDKILKDGLESANAMEREVANAASLLELTRQLSAASAERVQYAGQMTGFWDAELASMRQAREFESQISAARRQMAESLGGDAKPFIVKQQAADRSAVDQDLKNRREELRLQQAAGENLYSARNNITAENAANEAARTTELANATRDLADSKGRLKAIELEAAAAKDKEQTMLRQSAAAVASNITKIEERIASLREQKNAEEQSGQSALSEASKNLAASDAKIKKTQEEIAALEQKKATLTELQKLEREKQAVAAVLKQQSELKAAEPELKRAIQTASTQQEATRVFADDMSVLRTTAKDGRAAGKRAAEELELQRQAADLAEKTGMEHGKAVALLKEQKDLRNDISKIPEGTIKERLAARQAERAAARTEQRNERVAEAQRKREARGPDGKPTDFNKGREDLNKLLADADRKRAEAEKNLAQNVQKQTEIQIRIERALAALGAV